MVTIEQRVHVCLRMQIATNQRLFEKINYVVPTYKENECHQALSASDELPVSLDEDGSSREATIAPSAIFDATHAY